MKKGKTIHKPTHGSFRDPSGFIFHRRGVVYRQINLSYKKNFDFLLSSGLFEELRNKKLIVDHEPVNIKISPDGKAYKIIKPSKIPFISYPYEWCFSQLKDAALLTLNIQKIAIKRGMTLKDASAYNIQFVDNKPILIDTLSFEKYKEGNPWQGYFQFCKHFLAPLALMSYKDLRLNQLARLHVDGVPLDLVSSLLPSRSYLKISMLVHIHLHARGQKLFSKKEVREDKKTINTGTNIKLVASLETAIKKLNWKSNFSIWGKYYDETNYSDLAMDQKKKIVKKYLDIIKPKTVSDYGANTGIFSEISSGMNAYTISFDNDPVTVEENYLNCKQKDLKNILPLVIDIANPTPPIGWENKERDSFLNRSLSDCALALALVHHLVVSNNLSFDQIAQFFNNQTNSLIIEFVEKSDSQVQKLLLNRKDIYKDYSKEKFENTFNKYFKIQHRLRIKGTKRWLYLMNKKQLKN